MSRSLQSWQLPTPSEVKKVRDEFDNDSDELASEICLLRDELADAKSKIDSLIDND